MGVARNLRRKLKFLPLLSLEIRRISKEVEGQGNSVPLRGVGQSPARNGLGRLALP